MPAMSGRAAVGTIAGYVDVPATTRSNAKSDARTTVDGKPVADRTDRLMRLFASPAADARDQARRSADEGARYNISEVSLLRCANVQPSAGRRPTQDIRLVLEWPAMSEPSAR